MGLWEQYHRDVCEQNFGAEPTTQFLGNKWDYHVFTSHPDNNGLFLEDYLWITEHVVLSKISQKLTLTHSSQVKCSPSLDNSWLGSMTPPLLWGSFCLRLYITIYYNIDLYSLYRTLQSKMVGRKSPRFEWEQHLNHHRFSRRRDRVQSWPLMR